ncbi:MAG: flavin reductase family protein [Candidatus Bathyarchaeia archaeon]
MQVRKVEVDLSRAYRLLHPRNVVMVSCIDKTGEANIITLAWSMPTSAKPPLVAISVSPRRYSHRLIAENKEFVVNIPTIEIARETLFCGRISGRKCDKFKEAPFTTLPARKVQAPLIKECVAHLECKLVQEVTTGDHTIFIGEVLAAHVNEGVFDGKFDISKVNPIYHLGGDDFATLSSEVVTPRL